LIAQTARAVERCLSNAPNVAGKVLYLQKTERVRNLARHAGLNGSFRGLVRFAGALVTLIAKDAAEQGYFDEGLEGPDFLDRTAIKRSCEI